MARGRLSTAGPWCRERARDGVGYLTPGTFSFSHTSDRDRPKGLPGAWLVSNALNFSHVEGALPAWTPPGGLPADSTLKWDGAALSL